MLSGGIPCGKVKGKQVKFLHEPVTVIAERYANIVTERSGRLYTVLRHKSGNLPFVGTWPQGQGHEVLIVLLCGLPGESVCVPSACSEGFFRYAVRPFKERKIIMKKTLALIISLACLTAAATSCGAAPAESTPAEPAATEAATEEATEAPTEEETEAPTEPETEEETEAEEEAEEDEEDEENYDTGDASLDNIRNEDNIGDNELLVLSFGTSFNDSRRFTIGAIEASLEKAFPDYSVRRGFTANIIIDHIQRRDGILIDDINKALERAVDNGVKNLVIQPTHLMNGIEYNEIVDTVAEYSDAFEKVVFGEPLLTSDDDFKRVENAIVNWTAEYDDGKTAICFMGHGTEADSNSVYAKMQDMLTADGHKNYFIGTVEAEPSLEDVISKVNDGSYEKVVLEPLMVVAGDHANNDMAGDDEDSWKSAFEAEGYEVECVLRGLGENEAIRQIYVEHAQKAIDSIK